MLVLSRREKQRIRLGDSIVLTVVRVAGDRVRIGIEAPRDMLILRDELDAYDAGRDLQDRDLEGRDFSSSPTEDDQPQATSSLRGGGRLDEQASCFAPQLAAAQI